MGKSSSDQVKVRSMVGSWDAWHCRVRFSPTLMSALDGANVILVASAGKEEGGLLAACQSYINGVEHPNDLTLPKLTSSLSNRSWLWFCQRKIRD